MSGAKYVRFATSGEIDGLTPNTTYYVKVRAINSDGDNLSAYSRRSPWRPQTYTSAPGT